MDWKYLFSLLSFLIGFLFGFQAIYDRYKSDPVSAMRTRYGLSYVCIRGAIPALIFVSVYRAGYLADNVAFLAAASGGGLEFVVRLKIYFKEVERDGGRMDLLKGPFDLLQWIQNWFLEEVATSLAATRLTKVKSKLPAGVNFPELCQRASDNLYAFSPQSGLVEKIEAEIQSLRKKFEEDMQKGHDPEELDRRYRERLGLAISYLGGPRVFDILMQ